jgi:hypothetical protein
MHVTIVGDSDILIYGFRNFRGLYPQKLALTSPTSGCHSFGIVHSWTQAMGFRFFFGTSRAELKVYLKLA